VEISGLRRIVDRRKIERSILLCDISASEAKIIQLKEVMERKIKARWVLSEVARITQERFTGYVENLVTLAIQSVFDRPLKLLVKFEIKRNNSECLLLVQDGDKEPYVPKDEMGGGLLDVISFALRVVLWSLEQPRSRNVLLLDEPMKFVGHGEMQQKAGDMLRDISHRLGIQLIILTHEPELMAIADRSWNVVHDGTMSHVSQVGAEEKKPTKSAARIKRRKSP